MKSGRWLAAGIVVISLAIAGCGGGSESANQGAGKGNRSAPPTEDHVPTIAAIPSQSSADALTLPIEPYLFTSTQMHLQGAAMWTLESECMAKSGFALPPSGINLKAPDLPLMMMRYGPDSEEEATAGYHYKVQWIDTHRGAAPPPPTYSDAEKVALYGRRTSGVAPGSGGCAGAAKARLTTGGAVYGAPDLPQQIQSQGYYESLSDPRVKSAFSQWSSCMKQAGYSYSDPVQAANDRKWSGINSQPAPDEIATAEADVRCKQQAHVVGTWFAVESALEKELMDKHAQELTALKVGMDTETRLVASIVSSG